MDYELLIVFIVLNIVNVIIQTVKSIATIKCGKGMAALVNAIAYGLYTVVVVYTVCDLPLWLKVVVVGLCNLVGVFCVKWGEEKARKDKLWKVEATINEPYKESLIDALKKANLPFNYIEGIGKYVLFNIYCPTQEESKAVKGLLDFHKAKYFVTESKTL
jgi:uncharacterized protein YebE (UPF0316 family)